nr:MAG TPA: Protein of unknown function (DUF551) [Caudoviricetes sp.]
MSHIKDRLMQYEDEYSKYRKYDGLYGADVLDMIEQLQDDLELDENENDWIPVEKKLPDPGKDVAVLLKGFIPAIGRYELIRDGIGAFVVPGQIETPVEFRLPVTAWTPLPEPCKED